VMIDKERIRLFEITEIDGRPGYRDPGKHMKVTISHRDDSSEPVLQATFYLGRNEWPDDSIWPVAKSWLHKLCHEIATATQEWALSDERLEALKRRRPSTPHGTSIPS